MSSVSVNNKRIAKNTIVVYARLIIVTIIGLLTSRLVLQRLGVSDYGLYSVVGGVITMFSVISGSMSATTIRFLNYEIGKNEVNPNKIFNLCNVTHIAFAFIILILAETIGLFYIYNYLNVEPGKEGDAMFVFQVSTIVACIGIINVPYQSVFVAKEKFVLLAIINIAFSIIKLGLVGLLFFYKGDNALKLYAIIMSVSTFLSFIIYHYLCYKDWPDLVRWKFYKNFKNYKEILNYNNYNILASIAYVGRSQGSNILINYFFGTVVNGAYGIARTVEGFVMSFTVNFDTAAAPQITQNVGKGDIEQASSIACRSCRMCILLSLLAALPLFLEMELVLKLWLGTVPDYTVSFCRYMIIAVVVAATGGGFLRLKDAMGKIKWFMLQYSFWYLLSFPVGYLLLKLGCPPVTVVIIYVVTDLINRLCQIYLMKRIYNFDIISFCKKAYTRPLIIILMMTIYSIIYLHINISSTVEHVIALFLTGIVALILIYTIGLTASERKKCLVYIKNRIKVKKYS